MSLAVRREPEVARLNVTTGRVSAGDLDPLRERLLRDVGRPGVKQPPEIVVPLLAGQFTFERAPGWGWFGDVELQHVWTCGAAVRFQSLTERRVLGEKEAAVGEGNEG